MKVIIEKDTREDENAEIYYPELLLKDLLRMAEEGKKTKIKIEYPYKADLEITLYKTLPFLNNTQYNHVYITYRVTPETVELGYRRLGGYVPKEKMLERITVFKLIYDSNTEYLDKVREIITKIIHQVKV
jgi:hypothetical protein